MVFLWVKRWHQFYHDIVRILRKKWNILILEKNLNKAYIFLGIVINFISCYSNPKAKKLIFHVFDLSQLVTGDWLSVWWYLGWQPSGGIVYAGICRFRFAGN
jgi:hypothetical protein